jgi:hypothetical protein
MPLASIHEQPLLFSYSDVMNSTEKKLKEKKKKERKKKKVYYRIRIINPKIRAVHISLAMCFCSRDYKEHL